MEKTVKKVRDTYNLCEYAREREPSINDQNRREKLPLLRTTFRTVDGHQLVCLRYVTEKDEVIACLPTSDWDKINRDTTRRSVEQVWLDAYAYRITHADWKKILGAKK